MKLSPGDPHRRRYGAGRSCSGTEGLRERRRKSELQADLKQCAEAAGEGNAAPNLAKVSRATAVEPIDPLRFPLRRFPLNEKQNQARASSMAQKQARERAAKSVGEKNQ
jgi:hypothetical protein